MKLIYDIKSMPKELGPANLIKILDNHRVVLWDSSLDGIKPKFSADATSPIEAITLVDMKGKELDITKYQKDFEDKEFWEKELHRCQNSPLYYYSNYATTTYPVNNKLQGEWLKAKGLESLEAKDNEEAEKLWAEQKDKIAGITEGVTIDDLKSMQGSMEVLKELYIQLMEDTEKEIEHLVDIKNSDGESLDERKKVINLTTAISRIKHIPEEYSQYMFKNQKGYWDKAMLKHTPYPELLKIFIAVNLWSTEK